MRQHLPHLPVTGPAEKVLIDRIGLKREESFSYALDFRLTCIIKALSYMFVSDNDLYCIDYTSVSGVFYRLIISISQIYAKLHYNHYLNGEIG